MIKKLKLLSVIFSTMILFPFNALAISCSGKKEIGNSSVLSVSNKENENDTPIIETIKEFIKNSFYGDKNSSIVSLEDLQENMDSQTNKNLEIYLNTLNNKLNNSDLTNIELDNQIIIQGLKNRIIENCDEVEEELKDPNGDYSDEFKEVGLGKVLENGEDNIIFNLKKFDLREILDSYRENDESNSNSLVEDTIFADSAKLKIYNFNTNLELTLNYGNGKKHLISIRDYNLFVVLDKEKANLLTDGISKYLEDKIIKNSKNDQNAIPIYLDGQPNKKVNEYLSEITKKNNFDLTDQKNIAQIEHYLSMIYLPEIIFRNNDKEDEIKVLRKKAIITEKDKNIGDLKMNPQTKENEQINFLNLFGNDNGKQKITDPILKNNIIIENFLTDHQFYLHENNTYYLLGTGNIDVKRWIIKGFSLNPIKFTFKIFIKAHILTDQIDDLRTCLDHLTYIMADSKAMKRNSLIASPTNKDLAYKEKYTVNIEIPKKHLNNSAVQNVFVKPEPWSELENILNALFIERTKERTNVDFPEGNIDYKFTTLTNILRFKVGKKQQMDYYSDNGSEFPTLDKIINIYFVFNSFRINLTNDLFLKRRQVELYKKNQKNHKTGKFEKVDVTEDGSKIWFR